MLIQKFEFDFFLCYISSITVNIFSSKMSQHLKKKITVLSPQMLLVEKFYNKIQEFMKMWFCDSVVEPGLAGIVVPEMLIQVYNFYFSLVKFPVLSIHTVELIQEDELIQHRFKHICVVWCNSSQTFIKLALVSILSNISVSEVLWELPLLTRGTFPLLQAILRLLES